MFGCDGHDEQALALRWGYPATVVLGADDEGFALLLVRIHFERASVSICLVVLERVGSVWQFCFLARIQFGPVD